MEDRTYNEVMILSITIGTLVLSIAVIVWVTILHFQHANLMKRYKKFLEIVNLFETNTLIKSLHRLDIISRKNIEYRAKYKRFESQFESLEQQMNDIRIYSWNRDLPKTRRKFFEIKKILAKYEAESQRVQDIKRELETQISMLLQSDKTLDQEMSLLKQQFKKIEKKYKEVNFELSDYHDEITKLQDDIMEASEKFEANYKNVHWESCTRYILEYKQLLWIYGTVVNKGPVISFFLKKYIPEMIKKLEADQKIASKLMNKNFAFPDFEEKYSKIKHLYADLEIIIEHLTMDVSTESKLLSLLKLILIMQNKIELEVNSYDFFKKHNKEIFKFFENSIESLKNEHIKFLMTGNKSKISRVVYRHTSFVSYKTYEADLESFFANFEEFKKNFRSVEISNSKKLRSLNKLFENLQVLYKEGKVLFEELSKEIEKYETLKNSISKITTSLDKLVEVAKKDNVSIGPFSNRITSLKKDARLLNFKYKLRSFLNLKEWEESAESTCQEFYILKNKIEKKILFDKIYLKLIKMSEIQKIFGSTKNQRIKNITTDIEITPEQLGMLLDAAER